VEFGIRSPSSLLRRRGFLHVQQPMDVRTQRFITLTQQDQIWYSTAGMYRPAADTIPTRTTTARAKWFIGWQPIPDCVVLISTMQLKGIVMYGPVGRPYYRPAADNSIGYETVTVR
jgi:hypothetical protein